jgi:uncharacterized protein YccT (UPF0319 family)
MVFFFKCAFTVYSTPVKRQSEEATDASATPLFGLQTTEGKHIKVKMPGNLGRKQLSKQEAYEEVAK